MTEHVRQLGAFHMEHPANDPGSPDGLFEGVASFDVWRERLPLNGSLPEGVRLTFTCGDERASVVLTPDGAVLLGQALIHCGVFSLDHLREVG